MAKLEELLAQKAALDRQITQTQRAERTEALVRIRQLMADHGLTTADISAPSTASRKAASRSAVVRKKVAVKYVHPATGESWTGRGLKPRWLTAELNNGRSIADFAV